MIGRRPIVVTCCIDPSQGVGVRPLICRLNPLHYDVFYTKDFTVAVTNLSDKGLDLSKLCLQASSANKIAPSI
ncbi:DUF4354 family protein [Serratia fonticola]|nr:DUF4354 family protein [Serratia fonticola]AYM90334.1 DUF4354 family protein [Serratia sp. 3ACOL1]MBL5902539.1 DUF4354 family protein [Serratia fonticola]NTY88212.1 DUF4354 family protein [Serratia fonticola]NTZ13839.1 DUF4354 family protein [Serratia fonticola]